jgi:hypothetical protein
MKPESATVTLASLQQMKVDGHKIVGVVAWDYQMAQIVDTLIRWKSPSTRWSSSVKPCDAG